MALRVLRVADRNSTSILGQRRQFYNSSSFVNFKRRLYSADENVEACSAAGE
jgi:hypothetical protein